MEKKVHITEENTRTDHVMVLEKEPLKVDENSTDFII